MPWWTHVALRDALDDQAALKMAYLQGSLELISPSTMQEDAKKIIARLVEIWAVEHDVDLDLAPLLRFVQLGKNQTQLIKAYQAALRRGVTPSR